MSNITTLRGLEPRATRDEIEAAVRHYVRKVSGVQVSSSRPVDVIEEAVRRVTEATVELLDQLPARSQPPRTVPPQRRRPSVAVNVAKSDAR